jgi:hypothetical protein
MKSAIYPFILAISLAAGSAPGADTTPSATPAAPADPAVERYTAASARQDWGAAAAAMRDALSRDAGNADFHSLYAYSLRKGGSPDMDLVFKHYNEALRIDAKHRGAHEYIGEAYLMAGNVAKAKEHLGALDKLCFFGCAEFNDLKKAIAEYETKRTSR